MKSARKIFRAGFTCPYIEDEIRPQNSRAGFACPYIDKGKSLKGGGFYLSTHSSSKGLTRTEKGMEGQ